MRVSASIMAVALLLLAPVQSAAEGVLYSYTEFARHIWLTSQEIAKDGRVPRTAYAQALNTANMLITTNRKTESCSLGPNHSGPGLTCVDARHARRKGFSEAQS